MPPLNLREKKHKSSWKSIAKSILSPYIPKNKFILKDMLKNYENIKKMESSSSKKLGFSTQTIQKSYKIIKNPRNNTIETRNMTCPIDSDDSLAEFLQPPHCNNNTKFGIFVRRRSCYCSECGKNTKFHDKINKFLPESKIKFHIFYEKKRRIHSMNYNNSYIFNSISTKNKLKPKIMNGGVSSAMLKTSNPAFSMNQTPLLKSARLKQSIKDPKDYMKKDMIQTFSPMLISSKLKHSIIKDSQEYDNIITINSFMNQTQTLKNTAGSKKSTLIDPKESEKFMETFIKSRKESLSISKDKTVVFETDIKDFHIDIIKKKEIKTETGLKKENDDKILRKNNNLVKYKSKPANFFEKFLKKDENVCKKIKENYENIERNNFNSNKKSNSFACQNKEKFIHNIYNSKNELNYFKELLQLRTYQKKPKSRGKTLPII